MSEKQRQRRPHVVSARLAVVAAFVTAGLGITAGLAFLFAPIQGGCSVTATSTVPGVPATLGPVLCRTFSLVEHQEVWPLPLLAIVVWSLAPVVTLFGVRRRFGGQSTGKALIFSGLVLEATVLASFGAGLYFAPLVLLPLLLTVVLTLRVPPVEANGGGGL